MAIDNAKREQFINALLKKVRTDDERNKLSELILSSMGILTKEVSTSPSSMEWIHDPKKVANFLKKFSTDPILKYCVHSWDQSEFTSYKDFINKVEIHLCSDVIFKDMYHYNIGLNYSLHDFILKNNIEKSISWSEDKIQIGLRYPESYIQKWIDENPGKDIMAMPLSELPKEHRPKKRYNGRSLANMEDVCELFKHIIEFRNNDFEKMIKQTFKNSDYIPDYDESIKGNQFYAYTPSVKFALTLIAGNIRGRVRDGAPSAVKIFVHRDEDVIDLHIQHIGSYADCDINREKLKEGTLANLSLHKRQSLLSVCDYCMLPCK